MISSKEEIQTKLSGISEELNEIYPGLATFENRWKAVRLNILDLIGDTATFLSQREPLNFWHKHQIVEALNAVNWDWLHLAITRINLVIIDENKIAKDINYAQ